MRFVLVGTGGFALNLCVYAALFELGARYLAASVLAYLASNAAMYVGNRYFTFGLSHDGFLAAYLRFALVGSVVAGLAAALLAIFVEAAGVDPRIGQAIALGVLVPVSYAMSKRFAFSCTRTARTGFPDPSPRGDHDFTASKSDEFRGRITSFNSASGA